MANLTLSVPDISCQHCKESIEGAIGALDAVGTVEVAINPRTVEVEFSDSPETRQAIVEAIEDQGYTVANA